MAMTTTLLFISPVDIIFFFLVFVFAELPLTSSFESLYYCVILFIVYGRAEEFDVMKCIRVFFLFLFE